MIDSKNPIKIEWTNPDELIEFIEVAYFGQNKGKLNPLEPLVIKKDTTNWIILNNLNMVKIKCHQMMEGSLLCKVHQTEEDIELYPLNQFAVKNNNYYMLY